MFSSSVFKPETAEGRKITSLGFDNFGNLDGFCVQKNNKILFMVSNFIGSKNGGHSGKLS